MINPDHLLNEEQSYEKPLFTPPPSSYLAQFEQLRTKVANYEYQLRDKQKHTMNNFECILNLFNTCEMLALNFAILVDLPFDEKNKKLQDLFDRCFSIRNGSYLYNLNNPDGLSQHLMFLINFIIECNTTFKKNNIFESAVEMSIDLEQNCLYTLNQQLDASNALFSSISKNLPNPDSRMNLDINYGSTTNNIEENSQIFAHWLINEYNISLPLKIERLTNCLSYRLTTISNLQEIVTKLSEISSLYNSSTHEELYDAKVIVNHEKYKSLVNICCFIKKIIQCIDFNKIGALTHKLSADLEEQTKTFENSMKLRLESYENEYDSLSHWISQNEKALIALKKTLSSTVQENMKIFSDLLPSNSNPITPQDFYNIRGRARDSTLVMKIDNLQNIYQQCNDIYQSGLSNTKEVRDFERKIIDINSKRSFFSDTEHDETQQQNIIDLNSNLKHFLDFMAPSNEKYKEVGEEIEKLDEKTTAIEKRLTESFDKIKISIGNQKLPIPTNVMKKREKLLDKIKRLDEKIIEKKKQLYELTEERSINGKAHIDEDKKADVVNPIYQSNFAVIEKKIICPVCHLNYRNILLEECGHVVCKYCFEEKRSKKHSMCPICHKEYDYNFYTVLQNEKLFANSNIGK